MYTLHVCRFTGGLNAFNECSKLRVLDLSENQITGQIDFNTIHSLVHLDVLYLQHNLISGTFPPELCLLTQLQRLNLSHNNLRGLIPHNIGELANLESFLLTGNVITGPVPLSISKLTKLKDFHVFRSYPSEIATTPVAFNKRWFERVYTFGPSVGLNNMNWDYKQLYGRDRADADNESVSLFSGTL